MEYEEVQELEDAEEDEGQEEPQEELLRRRRENTPSRRSTTVQPPQDRDSEDEGPQEGEEDVRVPLESTERSTSRIRGSPRATRPVERARIRTIQRRERSKEDQTTTSEEVPPPLPSRSASRITARQTAQHTVTQLPSPSLTKAQQGKDEKQETRPAEKQVTETGPALSTFTVVLTGQIESCQFIGQNGLCCRYQFVYGDDWSHLAGLEAAITQYAFKSSDNTLVWNFPIELSLKSTNVFGWPQIALSVYGSDFLNREVIRGYGSMRVPTVSGSFVKYVRLFRPISASWAQELASVFTGQRTEYNDPKFVCRADGRKGVVKVHITVLAKGMAKFGITEELSSFAHPNII